MSDRRGKAIKCRCWSATSSEPSATFHFMFLRSRAHFCSSLSINFTHCRQEVYSERSGEKEAAPQRTRSYMVKVTRASVMSFDTRREIYFGSSLQDAELSLIFNRMWFRRTGRVLKETLVLVDENKEKPRVVLTHRTNKTSTVCFKSSLLKRPILKIQNSLSTLNARSGASPWRAAPLQLQTSANGQCRRVCAVTLVTSFWGGVSGMSV